MFRREKPAAAPADVPSKEGGKGRPTPSRRDAEAANKAKAKQPRTRKELATAQRDQRGESSRKVREAMKTGDERYLPARDKGPLRRFTRDFVDSRFSVSEILIPLMFVVIIASASGNARFTAVGNAITVGGLLFFVLEAVLLRFRLRREYARRFPGESTKGTTFYAVTRSMQLRFLRLPKPQVKIGSALPESYR